MSQKNDDSYWVQEQESTQRKQDSNLIKQTDSKNKKVNDFNPQSNEYFNLNHSKISSSSSDWVSEQKTSDNKIKSEQSNLIIQNNSGRGDRREDIKIQVKSQYNKKQYTHSSKTKNSYTQQKKKVNNRNTKQNIIYQDYNQNLDENIQQLIQNPKISQYDFTMSYKNVIVQVIQCSPQIMSKHFDCIAIPFLSINSKNHLISLLEPKITIGQRSQDIRSKIIQEIQKGSFAISQAFFMSRMWFKDSPYQWRKGVLGRIPKFGDFDDRKLLITTVQRILSFYEHNLLNKQQNGSIIMPWIAQTFSTKEGSQLHIQGIFKYILKSSNSKIKRITIAVKDPKQLNDLKLNLRKRLVMLSCPQKY